MAHTLLSFGDGDGGCRFWQPVQADSQPKSYGLVLGRRPVGAVLLSSNEPGELSQWLCHADSTINIVLDIIIIIIIIIVLFSFPACDNLWEYIVYIAEFCRHRTIACCGQSGSMFISRLYAGFGKHNILYK